MKKVILSLLALLLALLIIIVFKTMTFSSMQKTMTFSSVQKTMSGVEALDFGKKPVEHLSRAISFPTISYERNAPIDTVAFMGYHQFLSETYPLVHSKLKKEVFSGFSLLYTWEGTDKTLEPIILMGHMDVVPAPDTASWTYPPFAGRVHGGYIWGRGSLDDKASMVSILEATEALLAENHQPKQTIYIAFGHDEEIGGTRGAEVIASALAKRGVKAGYILDEGMAITQGMIPMINKPVALIGTSEKGQMSVTLSVKMEGGHSSTPEKETAISVLCKAMDKVQGHPMKSGISGSVNDFIRYIGPEMPWYAKILFANSWLFKKVLIHIYQSSASGNALVSTTAAPTILRAGSKSNVLPEKAEAVINFRILPGETSKNIIKELAEVISDDRVKLTVDEWLHEPSPVSPINTHGFEAIEKTIRQVYPETLVAPTLMLASSDSKSYSKISKNIYKFAPLYVTSQDMARIHGINERNAISSFNRGINFYYRLMKNSSGI
ncbi:MAG: M20 family peptidase [Bacteroidales bacterium]|nr:M20 family peptidase [Bacteroidales bacterium]